MTRSAWHLRTGAVVLPWTVLLVVAVLGRDVWPASQWLLIHLLTLGVVSNAIFIWTWHFAETLLRLPDAGRPAQVRRLLLLNAGIVLLIVGMCAVGPPLVAGGAGLIVLAAVWHLGALGVRMRTALGNRFAVCVRYYVAAGVALAVGGALGALLGIRTPAGPWAPALHLAHVIVNGFGWIGLTVVGTLVTLWPTMLRTRMVPGAERATRRALPLLVAGLAIAAGTAFTGVGALVALGLAVYAAGLVVVGVPFVATVRQRPPGSFATWSMLLGVTWLVATVVALGGLAAASASVPALYAHSGWLVPSLLIGAVTQILVGALSFLIPVVLGGGPSLLRSSMADVARAGAARLAVVNLGLPLCLLPVPHDVAVVAAWAVAFALASTMAVLVAAVARHRFRSSRSGDGPARRGHQRPRAAS